MDNETIILITKLWPIFLAFIILVINLAQSHYRIKVLEEKVKSAFDLINKLSDRKLYRIYYIKC